MYTTIAKEWTTKAGLQAVLLRVNLPHFGDYYCGYVQVPVDHPWYGEDYAGSRDEGDVEIDIDVHGGVTFSGQPHGIDHGWWFGFDCAHYQDQEYPKDIDFCTQECENMAQQIKENAN